ncbi:MAG: DNA starvation/stationary phase protection protein [Myxococcales bacterium]|nr:DNA starvation/stationary phase protection protein [Myxococcales bacterium]MCB9644574.1 DNA starvation/stationary phase protection protein [Myxococcales bacterium]
MSQDKVLEGLLGLMANSSVFYQKLRNYHWNVRGEKFFELHLKFEELYNEWAAVVDELAERILMLGGSPLGTLTSILERATLKEESGRPASREMVQRLSDDLDALLKQMESVIELSEEVKDRKTTNVLDGIGDQQRVHLWMLRSWLAN